MMYGRYESPELQEWKKLTKEEQFLKVQTLSKSFIEKLKPVFVKDQSIKVDMFVPKSEYYELLVKYEAYLRESLGNIPLIVLVQEKLDENKRRQ